MDKYYLIATDDTANYSHDSTYHKMKLDNDTVTVLKKILVRAIREKGELLVLRREGLKTIEYNMTRKENEIDELAKEITALRKLKLK